MATYWQDEMVPMLRIIINDVGAAPTYTDGRLETILVVAAHLIQTEISYSNTYVIKISDTTITPDPYTAGDTTFMNFTVMKSACLVDQSTFRTEALRAGVKARLGDAVLETMDRLSGFKELLNNGPCQAFEAMKDDFLFGSGDICKAILSPFVGNDFDSAVLTGSDYRWRN